MRPGEEKAMITVVITTYKRAWERVQAAVESVCSQTWTDWELIVVDDTPPELSQLRDAVKAGLEGLQEPRIQYVRNEQNRGACYSRNVGLSLARGAFIAFLDDDDRWVPEKLALQYEEMLASGPETALVYGGTCVVDETEGTQRLANTSYEKGDVFMSLLCSNIIGSTSVPLIRTEALRQIGGFDEQMPAAQDADVWLRLAYKYPVSCVQQPLLLYYIHKGERISGDPGKKIRALHRLEEKWSAQLQENPNILYLHRLKLARYYAMNRQLGKSLKLWWSAVKLCPRKWVRSLRQLGVILKNRLCS